MLKRIVCLLLAVLSISFAAFPVAADGYGSSTDPKALAAVLEAAKALPSAQDLYFTPDTELLEDTVVDYYLDSTMLCLVWKRPVGKTVYNYFEVCIAEPEQFGRYLPGYVEWGGAGMNVEEMAAELGAVLVSSGDFYGLRGISVEINDGVILRADSQMMLDLCMIDRKGDLHCVPQGVLTTREEIQAYIDEYDINFCLEFGPTLYDGGQRQTLPGWYLMGQNAEEYTRAALCQLGPLHYLIVTANSYGYYWQAPTLEAFADVLGETGCVTAYTMDGGQTASVAFHGKLVNQVNYGGMRAISDGLFFMSGKQ